MTPPVQHSVSVAAVVFDTDRRVLVIKRRDNGAWQVPGGVLEHNETITDGLRREVYEETGLHVEPVRLAGVYKNLKLGVVALVFLSRITSGTPAPTEESAAVDWWTVERVDAEMNETFAIRIRDALRVDAPPAVRAHDGTHLLHPDCTG